MKSPAHLSRSTCVPATSMEPALAHLALLFLHLLGLLLEALVEPLVHLSMGVALASEDPAEDVDGGISDPVMGPEVELVDAASQPSHTFWLKRLNHLIQTHTGRKVAILRLRDQLKASKLVTTDLDDRLRETIIVTPADAFLPLLCHCCSFDRTNLRPIHIIHIK